MITANLILTIAGLLFILIVLVALYVWSSKSKTVPETVPTTIETFESLSAIIKNRSSSARELNHAVEMILSHFGTITSHTVGKYKLLLEELCTHPRTDSKLILRFEKTLRMNNPTYAHDIEKSLALGLAQRG
ncbi:MAG: hypothetical protein A2552_09045 [Sulfuricurvum sp. RIFOXYD2_FULL_44_160]|uniref:hypothetical protein n=1 Tax=Sulfuricurvum sp. RIFOXYD2_FULL_44_160 TaxID=1802249 RepID=UPI0008BC98B4|nr:hypothetical protein [Sulfuricurvum sp. RIFOXYD2_FULL_44_160]OHD96118.1 MAG: hypothetical protein A2552_09045 [Sulfuricurvum sp. RIFOXYD2_FULL_44_160]